MASPVIGFRPDYETIAYDNTDALHNKKPRFEPHFDRSRIGAASSHVMRMLKIIAPRVRARFGDPITDHSYFNPKTGEWDVVLDQQRLLFKDKLHTPAFNSGVMMMEFQGVTGTIGAAWHEAAHTYYTPKDWNETEMTKAAYSVFTALEDAYVNHRMYEDLLYGVRVYYAHAFRWSNPYSTGLECNKILSESPSFGTALQCALYHDYIERITIESDYYEFSDLRDDMRESFHKLMNRLAPISDKLLDDDAMDYSDRKIVYDEYAEEVKKWCEENNIPIEADAFKPRDTGDQDDYGLPGECDWNISEKEMDGDTGKPTDRQMNELIKAAIKEANDSLNWIHTNGLPVEIIGFEKSSGKTRPNIDVANSHKLREIFQARSNIRRRVVHGTDTGRISQRRLHKIVGGAEERIFRTRPITTQQGADIVIVIDASGSMNGLPIQMATKAAGELYEALNPNPDYSVAVWFYGASGQNISIAENIDNFEDKAWGGTPSYQACEAAGEWLLRTGQKTTKKLVIHITDLEPGDGPSDKWNDLWATPGLFLRTMVIRNDGRMPMRYSDLNPITVAVNDVVAYAEGYVYDLDRS